MSSYKITNFHFSVILNCNQIQVKVKMEKVQYHVFHVPVRQGPGQQKIVMETHLLIMPSPDVSTYTESEYDLTSISTHNRVVW